MSTLAEAALIRRVHDRLGFGAAAADLAAAQKSGMDDVLDELWGQLAHPSAGKPPELDEPHEQAMEPRPGQGKQAKQGKKQTDQPGNTNTPSPDGSQDRKDPEAKKARRQERRKNGQAIELWWLDQMVSSPTPLPERLTWFWHGHFATSIQKVKTASLMLRQNQSLRSLGSARFRPLAKKMIIDPAMLVWLDGPKNTVKAPNENLGREFMELFALGHGHYSEDDVKAAARVLTGWKVRRSNGQVSQLPRQHDDSTKTVLGRSGDFDAEAFVDLLCDQAAGQAFVVSRLWARLVSTTPPSADTMSRLTRAYGTDGDIPAVLKAITAEAAFADTSAALVKQPVEWLVGLMRATGVRPAALPQAEQKRLLGLLRGMGQIPFTPPSVGGWPAGHAWLTTSAALSRTQAARLIAGHADLAEAGRTSTKQRPEYFRRLLGIDSLSSRTSDAIAAVADRPQLAATVAACAPEYVVSA